MSKVNKNCKVCNKVHSVKTADLNRGWGQCCSKHCAAILRENNSTKGDRYKQREIEVMVESFKRNPTTHIDNLVADKMIKEIDKQIENAKMVVEDLELVKEQILVASL